MKKEIKNINKKVKKKKPSENDCTCRGGIATCPLEGKCNKEKNIIYCCTITRLDTNTTETYTGLTEDSFKDRLYGHNGNIRHREQSGTKLSQYIWYLKDSKQNVIDPTADQYYSQGLVPPYDVGKEQKRTYGRDAQWNDRYLSKSYFVADCVMEYINGPKLM